MNFSPYVNAEMTYPKFNKPMLITLAYSNVSPYAPVLLTFSDPAKSTK